MSSIRERSGRHEGTTGRPTSEPVDTMAALDALEDPDCRALLEATTGEALTAHELIEACDVPRSTTYRKVERLVAAGLLEERVRIRSDGKHASEYRRAFENVVVSLSASDGIEVGISGSAPGEA
ncbi:winged helix-turn-helix domain-containing protein [Natronomonas marina]|jgi:predicted transcriptional regulator|uniref:winged helix-turn-helix domain-containing protein n=1 Tax=Natronomonas marina TaxID=2961939 RepID=UPI0020C93C80|nr:helix-turn-helix domain-containing protein [Natronomonas marina]